MPLPGTRLIPTDWSQHHQPAAESTMTSTCTISRRPTGTGTLDPNTGTVTNPATLVALDVPCRVQAVPARDRTQDVAGQQVTQRDYMIAIPIDTPTVRVDDLVTVTDGHDPALTGRALRVVDVMLASEPWQRDLRCRDNLG